MKWIVCQIGAREHYAVARALHRRGELAALVTDFWVPPGNWAGKLPGMQRLRERWHPELADARVLSMNVPMLAFELSARIRRLRGWPRNMARNAFFARRAVAILSPLHAPRSTLFSYSYAAAALFGEAKRRGWTAVLGQIDPGPEEERIVAAVSRRHGVAFTPAPADYWAEWKKETELADRIVVNSTWSMDCLRKEGIAEAKMVVVPLAFGESVERGAGSRNQIPEVGGRKAGASVVRKTGGSVEGRRTEVGGHAPDTGGQGKVDKDQSSEIGNQREYPEKFTTERPMRVLFLGQVNVRKGAVELLEAARMMEGEDVEFWLVGGVADRLLPDGVPGNVRLVGAVERGEAERWYRQADVFVLPTHSDGFALTQLEAQAHGLPVIASKHCGEVVKDGVNGTILPEVSAGALARSLRDLALNPQRLESMARESRIGGEFSLKQIGDELASFAIEQ